MSVPEGERTVGGVDPSAGRSGGGAGSAPWAMSVSSSRPSITASTPYSSVKVMSEVSTVARPTEGDTAWSVVISPNTAQGCRPASVKIQSNEFDTSGRTGRATPATRTARPGDRSRRRVAHSTHAPAAMPAVPSRIIRGNDR